MATFTAYTIYKRTLVIRIGFARKTVVFSKGDMAFDAFVGDGALKRILWKSRAVDPIIRGRKIGGL